MTALRLPDTDGTPTATSWVSRAPGTAHGAADLAHRLRRRARGAPGLADNTPGAPAVIDWDTTLAYRHELWSYGLGVADAMDTAQRGMGLDWPATQELIKRSGAEAAASAAGWRAGPAPISSISMLFRPAGRTGAVLDAYREQVELVSGSGAR